ncbi:IclR family transcriptional regulator [Hamadaea tsunoensis]|uniref:IclR family transcriptional regulator n=1 Tax=Hamadaea tsunoensis TaxID=53368 RepID=UPI0004225C2B|nr:helix-turn-helix domain-containing protein [Hamadaea tsunoensis]
MARSASSAVDKALDLIEAVAHADRPQRLGELATAVGLHRATAYRVLLDLVRRGWVLRVGEHYLPGATALQVSSAAAGHSLVAIAHPVLVALAERTDMMVNLQVLEARRSRVVDAVRPARLEMISHLRGETLPAHRFAGPLALVAGLAPDAYGPYLAEAEEAGYSAADLQAEIDRVRTTGYALERGRNDKVVASLSQAVPTPQPTPRSAPRSAPQSMPQPAPRSTPQPAPEPAAQPASLGPAVCALTIVGPDAEFTGERLEFLRTALAEAVADLITILTRPGGSS